MIEKKLSEEDKKAELEFINNFLPKTKLARDLLKIRRKMVEKGHYFLNEEEIQEKIKERRFG